MLLCVLRGCCQCVVYDVVAVGAVCVVCAVYAVRREVLRKW